MTTKNETTAAFATCQDGYGCETFADLGSCCDKCVSARRLACFLGIGPAVCTCGRTDGKHGLLCAL
jgi:hypothetical protein